MKRALLIIIFLLTILLGAEDLERALWNVSYEVPYAYYIGNFLPLPLYVNNRKVKDYFTQHIVDYFNAEISFWVKEGDVVDFRIIDPSFALNRYEIRDHKDRLMACSNPSSDYIGESPEPIKVRLRHGKLPSPASFKNPAHGETAFPLSGILEWSSADNLNPGVSKNKDGKLSQGYRVYWGKTGEAMKLIAEQNTSFCSVKLEDMEPDTEYQWKVVPFNEHGEARDCPIWKYRTVLFSLVAKFNNWDSVEDIDGDGELDFVDQNAVYIEDLAEWKTVLGYYKSYTGNFIEVGEIQGTGWLDAIEMHIFWHDVNNDGYLDIVYYCEDSYLKNNFVQAEAFLNLGDKFSDHPVSCKVELGTLQSNLRERVLASQPKLLSCKDTDDEYQNWVIMDADGDGIGDFLPAVDCYLPFAEVFEMWLDPEEVPFPNYYTHYLFGGKYLNLDVWLNKTQGGMVPPGFVNPNMGKEKWGSNEYWNWCDFDLDGDADLIYSYETSNYSIGITDIFRNDNGKLMPMELGMGGLAHNEFYWYDIDGDGDMDLIIGSTLDVFDGYQVYLNHTIRHDSSSSKQKNE